jgi:hypothetical protein
MEAIEESAAVRKLFDSSRLPTYQDLTASTSALPMNLKVAAVAPTQDEGKPR